MTKRGVAFVAAGLLFAVAPLSTSCGADDGGSTGYGASPGTGGGAGSDASGIGGSGAKGGGSGSGGLNISGASGKSGSSGAGASAGDAGADVDAGVCDDGDTQDCYSGDVGTEGIGACHKGTQSCAQGAWGACEGEVTPSNEICNGDDDDCDGLLDEELGQTTCGLGVCVVTVENCVDGVPQTCVPKDPSPTEKCDGVDDDCDGQIDEGCTCLDGTTQSCYSGAPNTKDVGVCKGGTQTCANGAWGACVGEVIPSAEACNNKDDNCDGQVDENNPGGGGSCNSGKLGVCSAGTLVCTAGKLECVQNVQPTAETCNGLDDDCNGTNDNGNNACGGACDLTQPPGTPCDGPDSDLCKEGSWQCSGSNAVTCSDGTGNSVEICNGVDDDCDGNIDEGSNGCGGVCTLTGTPGAACDGPDGDLCAEGVWQCNGKNAVTCSDNTATNVEICDSIDQDCDGNISEGPCSLPNASSTCTNGACAITSCSAGYGNCDTDPSNGCESALNTLANCTACGVSCNLANATESCSSGTCTLTGCTSGWGNCDNIPANGCETSLTTSTNCGSCGVACSGGKQCSGGSCACPTGQTDCGGACKNLSTDVTNCGACGNNCNNHANVASATCSAAACNYTCDPGWGNCTATAGCETALNTLTNCGACGTACSRAHGTASCSTGTCTLTGCNDGWADCDSNDPNGCELQNSGYSNSSPGENLGSWDADAAYGFGCPGATCEAIPSLTRTGTRGKYFTIYGHEASSCSAYVALRFELLVPSGVDYDLYVTGTACFADPSFSETGIGNKIITVWCNDVTGSDDSFTANVEVRFASGSSCTPWTLNVYRRGC